MERELKEVQHKAVGVEASYGRDMLDLAIAARYVSELLGRRTIARYLDDNGEGVQVHPLGDPGRAFE